MSAGVGHSRAMPKKAREVLAENLRAVLAAAQEAGMPPSAWAKAKQLQRKQVERVSSAAVGCSVDFLDDLARVLQVQPWQLLIPNLDVKKPPLLALTPEDIAKIEEVQRGAADLVRRFTLGRVDE